jgi:tetratricopeptide (TPR) repeat protein
MARSARVNADRIGALLMQGNALASQAPHRDAIRCYEKILELAPRNLDAINNRGNCLSLFGEFAEAIKSYDAIIAARPNDLRAHCNRANALKRLGRCHEALAAYERVLARHRQGERLAALADLRRTLRERIAGTAFGDPVRYARAVEGQYRSMWQRWCDQQRRVA